MTNTYSLAEARKQMMDAEELELDSEDKRRELELRKMRQIYGPQYGTEEEKQRQQIENSKLGQQSEFLSNRYRLKAGLPPVGAGTMDAWKYTNTQGYKPTKDTPALKK